ncbi:amidase [Sandaracinobacteroides saxicola]|uniref:Amidase n=2 Tax=Sandaracinobacteroides saxicola TaxID=2759707 RepID=A0A7G5IMR3_9SPHN|nr:amidase [Sandaracinobacteroides saxicola]
MANVAFAATPAAEITGWDATVLSARIKAKDVSCVEVMDAYLAQIKRFNPRINAIIGMADEGALRAQAAERDRQLAAGQYLGWMHGFPQAIKDTALAKGFVYTSGSPLLKGNIAKYDSVIVERAKAAGAIVIGKTNVPEWALGSNTFNPLWGTTWNPYDLKKTVGGSSGGAGAALAMRMLPVADGSDMGGSIRNPSAYNNVYGLRPGAGTVPLAPSPEVFVQQYAIEGPMGRTVKDVAMLLSVQAGHDPRAPLSVQLDTAQFTGDLQSDVKGKKIAWMGDWNGYFAMEPGVIDLCKSSLKVFESLGCIVEEAVPAFDPAMLWKIWLTQRAWIMGNYLGDYYANPAQRPLLSDNARWEVEQSFKLTANDVFQTSAMRSAWVTDAVRTFFEKYDFAIAPTAQVFPFDATIPWPREVGGRKMETYHQWMGIVLPWTLAGTPVMNLPVGFSAGGVPMGVQLIGKRQAELAVIKMAHAYEAATQWVQKRPPAILGLRG